MGLSFIFVFCSHGILYVYLSKMFLLKQFECVKQIRLKLLELFQEMKILCFMVSFMGYKLFLKNVYLTRFKALMI